MIGDSILCITAHNIGDAAAPTEEFLALTVGGDSAASLSYLPYYTMDPTTVEEISLFGFIDDRYTGGGIDLYLPWASVNSTTGNVRWAAGFRRIDTAENLANGHTFAFQGVTSACPGTLRLPTYPKISFTSSQIDGILKGEGFNIQIQRDADHADDTMATDAALLIPYIRGVET